MQLGLSTLLFHGSAADQRDAPPCPPMSRGPGFRTAGDVGSTEDPADPTRPEKEHPTTRPTRDGVRRSIADQLLGALDALVTRHRALALHDEHIELHAELIAAEVAHQLAAARSALQRHPQVKRVSGPAGPAG